jgi:hypothetical protein
VNIRFFGRSRVIESVVNDLGAVGIRAKVQPLERAAIQGAQRDKKVKNRVCPTFYTWRF